MKKQAPRMFPYVMQAVKDLKDIRGSTTRKILDQVHTAINIANVKPKPRNVVMQVERALKHGVESGVLKHTAGKYRLILDTKSKNKKNSLGMVKNKAISRTRHARKPKTQISNKTCRHERLTRTSRKRRNPRSSYSSCDSESGAESNEETSRTKRRRRRSLAKKSVQFTRGVKKAETKGRGRRLRQCTPIPAEVRSSRSLSLKREPGPTDGEINGSEESPVKANEIENVENLFVTECMNQEEDINRSIENEIAKIVETSPECDMAECVCNLKQEPSEDDENEHDADFYQ